MSNRELRWVLDQDTSALTPSEFAVAMRMADCANPDDGLSYPAAGKLATQTGLNIKTVRRAMDRLEALGFLIMVRPHTQHYAATYRFPCTVRLPKNVQPEPTRVDIDASRLPKNVHPEIPRVDIDDSRVDIEDSPEWTLQGSKPLRDVEPKNVNETTPRAGAEAREEAEVNASYALWTTFCDAVGLDQSAATKREKGASLQACKQLIDEGVTDDELRQLVGYLQSQSWRENALTLQIIAKELGPWRMLKRPAAAKNRTQERINANIVQFAAPPDPEAERVAHLNTMLGDEWQRLLRDPDLSDEERRRQYAAYRAELTGAGLRAVR